MSILYLALACILALLAPQQAYADSGEVTVSAEIDNEWSLLRHPYHDPGDAAPSMQLYVPRFGGSVTYGLHNRVLAGFSGRASIPRSTWAPVIGYQHYEQNDFFITTRDALATALARVTLFDGNMMFVDVGFEGGLSFRRWRASRHRSSKEPATSFQTYETTQPSRVIWQRAPYARVSATLRARPWQYLSLAVSPYVATTFRKDISVGAAIDIGVPIGAGPGA